MDARWLRLSRLLPSGEVVPDDAVTRSLLDAAGPKALACLSDREQEFLRLRYGLDEGKIRTARGGRQGVRLDGRAVSPC